MHAAAVSFFSRPSRRRTGTFFAAGMFLAFFSPAPATAQAVSEADRQAARELFQQGFQLQQAGNYAEALDKFGRAQRVFSAPTNLLHIAECQALLGQLVESSETYRGLVHLTLPKDAPQAFVAAQMQGAAELQQIDARIPRVRLEVTPSNVPSLAVTIDDQPMNVALVGVDRPINPGPHRVAAFAPGFGRQEKTVVIKEKDPPQPVLFVLQATVAPGSAPAPLVAGQAPSPFPGQEPPPSYGAQYTDAAPRAGEAYAGASEKPWTPPPRTWTSTGFFFGARFGAAVPTGVAAINRAAKAGPAVGLEGYFRFAHKGFLGILGEHDFYSGGTDAGTSSSSNFLAASIGFTTNAEGAGFMMDFFGGYRWYSLSTSGTSPAGDIPAGTYGSGEGGLGLGVWIAAGKSIRLVPRFEASFGSFSAENAPSGPVVGAASASTNASTNNGYGVLFLGLSGGYNIDLSNGAP